MYLLHPSPIYSLGGVRSSLEVMVLAVCWGHMQRSACSVAGPAAPSNALCPHCLCRSCVTHLYKSVLMPYDGPFSVQSRPKMTDYGSMDRMADESHVPTLSLAQLLCSPAHLHDVICSSAWRVVCVLSSHPLLIFRLRKVWQKRKCTIRNGYLTISHSMVGIGSSTLLCSCQGAAACPCWVS